MSKSYACVLICFISGHLQSSRARKNSNDEVVLTRWWAVVSVVFVALAPFLNSTSRAVCLRSFRRGFERADSEYTDKLQHYTSGHSEYLGLGSTIHTMYTFLHTL